jgi:hypothetical protein
VPASTRDQLDGMSLLVSKDTSTDEVNYSAWGMLVGERRPPSADV